MSNMIFTTRPVRPGDALNLLIALVSERNRAGGRGLPFDLFVHTSQYLRRPLNLLSASRDWTLRVWNPDSGDCMRTLQGHKGSVRAVCFDPTRNRIVSCSNDKTLRVWNADTGECMMTLRGHTGSVFAVSYAPKGDRVVSGSSDNTLPPL